MVLLFGSCCRKVECEERVEEEISFIMSESNANGFTDVELDSIVSIVYNPNTNEIYDSTLIYRQFYYTELKRNHRVFSINAIRRAGFHPLKGMNIILRNISGTYKDTLFDVQFGKSTHNYTCNPCINNLDGDSKPFIRNRAATYKDKRYSNIDFPIIITKK